MTRILMDQENCSEPTRLPQFHLPEDLHCGRLKANRGFNFPFLRSMKSSRLSEVSSLLYFGISETSERLLPSLNSLDLTSIAVPTKLVLDETGRSCVSVVLGRFCCFTSLIGLEDMFSADHNNEEALINFYQTQTKIQEKRK